MRWQWHFSIGLILSPLSAFFLWVSYVPGWSCGTNIIAHSPSCGYALNYQTLAIGSVCAFLVATEFILAFEWRKGE
ncbi:MAG: hypothetical protein ACREBS_00830, partial [Nitrososphaerales archaeon]